MPPDDEIVYIEAILLPLEDKFRTSLQDMTLQASDLLERGDFSGLDRMGHSIRGAAGYFGADRLKLLATELERAARSADGPTALGIIAELKRVLAVMILRAKADSPQA